MGSSAPLFSVLVATYNRPEMVAEAVASVLSQSVEDFECVVVDDASPTAPSLPADPRVRLVRRPVNGGQGASYNTGVEATSGRYIAFLDDDDRWTTERLAIALEGLARAPVAVCRSRVVGHEHRPTRRSRGARQLEGDVQALIRRTLVPNLGQTAVARDVMVPFDERLRASADVEWWIRLAERAEVTTVDRIGLLFRHHTGTRHGNDEAERIRAQLQMMEMHRDYFRRHRGAAAFQWKRIGIKALRSGDARLAVSSFSRSLVARPEPRTAWHLARAVAHLPHSRPMGTT